MRLLSSPPVGVNKHKSDIRKVGVLKQKLISHYRHKTVFCAQSICLFMTLVGGIMKKDLGPVQTFKRPGVAGAVLQSPPPFIIYKGSLQKNPLNP